MTFLGDVMVVTSLKWRHKHLFWSSIYFEDNIYFEVRLRHKQLQNLLFGQITELQVTNIEG